MVLFYSVVRLHFSVAVLVTLKFFRLLSFFSLSTSAVASSKTESEKPESKNNLKFDFAAKKTAAVGSEKN